MPLFPCWAGVKEREQTVRELLAEQHFLIDTVHLRVAFVLEQSGLRMMCVGSCAFNPYRD